MSRLSWIGALALSATLSPAFAGDAFRKNLTWDEVELVNGRDLQGSASWTKDGRLRLRLPLGQILVDAEDVLRVTFHDDPLEELERMEANGMARGTLADRLELARFCSHYGFETRARGVWRSILTLDPDHTAARLALGYVEQDGKWMTPKEARIARAIAERNRKLALGLVEFRGQWLKPEAVARLLEQERQARLDAEKRRLERELRLAKARALRAAEAAAQARERAANAEAQAARAATLASEAPVVVVPRRRVLRPCPPVRRRPYRRAYRAPRRRVRPRSSRPLARPRRRPAPRSSRPVRPKRPSPIRVIPSRRGPTTRTATTGRYLLRHQVKKTPTVNRGPGVSR